MIKTPHRDNTKWCPGCKRWIPLDGFCKSSGSWDLLDNRCRACRNSVHKKHHNYPSISQSRVPYNDKGNKWCFGCQDWKFPGDFGKNKHGWDGLTSQCRKCWQKIQSKSFAKPDIKKRRTEYQKLYKQKNIHARIKNNLSSRIHRALRMSSIVKSERTLELVGCSVEFLKTRLEGLWKDGMTWKNHGRNGWHIDHIIPCASFDLSKVKEQRKCFHFTNLQPMWGKENQSKGKKVMSAK